jgi:hypothetical protein
VGVIAFGIFGFCNSCVPVSVLSSDIAAVSRCRATPAISASPPSSKFTCLPFRSGERSHHYWPWRRSRPPRPRSTHLLFLFSFLAASCAAADSDVDGWYVGKSKTDLFTVHGCGGSSDYSVPPPSNNASADLSELLAAIPSVAAPRGLRRPVPQRRLRP